MAAASLAACQAFGAAGRHVNLIRVEGTIGPAAADYISRSIRVSASDRAECLIIELDTPGGLLDSTKQIVGAFYASPVPVVVYVSPEGASAGSAGCFITLAADVAAMAPHTNIGAAHPVSLGGLGDSKPDEVMAKKLENYGASYIETIAAKNHRNVEWARSAVSESASITAEKALELKVIDLIAGDVPDLLGRLDGRKVGGRTLATANAVVVALPMLAQEKVFQMLWRPEVMFILMLIAIYGIIGEMSNPGAVLPGVAGAIALILALYMSSILPINTAGVALIVFAIALFIIDAFAPTHGVLTVGGVISFFLGSLFLFDRTGPGIRLSLAMIVPATLITAAFFLFVVGAGLKAQLLPARVGREALVGKVVPALTPVDSAGGRVLVDGESWSARSETPIGEGQAAEIVGLKGLVLTVKPKS